MHPDDLVGIETWSELSADRDRPEIDGDRLHRYRTARLREQLVRLEADVVLIHNPISLDYAIGYRGYQLFQARIPTAYCYFAADGPTVAFETYGEDHRADETRSGHALSYFDGGEVMTEASIRLADDLVRHLDDIGARHRRVALEYVNPSLTRALLDRGVDVVDGMVVTERARLIKSADEIACMRWAVAVAEHGLARMEQAISPGVSELQLWGLVNYANLANDGGWHDGRMLASGPRTNPWLQEASQRRVEAGDLVGVDTDMVGPFGYFADVSRTFFCGPGQPSTRQKELYRLAVAEIEHNLTLVKPGMSFRQFREQAYETPEEFHEQAYTCLAHGVGMCDEYPRIDHAFRGPHRYDETLEPGMVLCIESYMGAVGERDGVKLEQQVLVTDDGYEPISNYPYDPRLLD